MAPSPLEEAVRHLQGAVASIDHDGCGAVDLNPLCDSVQQLLAREATVQSSAHLVAWVAGQVLHGLAQQIMEVARGRLMQGLEQKQHLQAAQLWQCAWRLVLAADLDAGNRTPLATRLTGQAASERLQMAIQLAREWVELHNLEQAEVCLSQGNAYMHVTKEWIAGLSPSAETETADNGARDVITTLFDALLLRSTVLWQLNEHSMCLQLASDCVHLIQQQATTLLGPARATALCVELADALIDLAVPCLSGGAATHKVAPAAAQVSLPPPKSAPPATGSVDAAGLLQLAHEVVAHAILCHDAATGARLHTGQAGDQQADNQAQPQQERLALLQSVQQTVLTWLTYHHVTEGQAADALTCLSKLQLLAPPPDLTSLMGCFKVKALMMSGQSQEAEAEFLGLVSDAAVSPTMCANMLTSLMHSPPPATLASSPAPAASIPAAVLKTSVELLLQRCDAAEAARVTVGFLVQAGLQQGCQQDITALDDLLMAFLVPDPNQPQHPANRLLTWLNTQPAAAAEQPDDAAVAALVPASARDTEQRGPVMQACRELLWSSGVQHFHQKRFQAGLPFLEASQLYSNWEQQLEGGKVLAMACMAMSNTHRAQSYLDQMEQLVYSRTPPDSSSSSSPAAALLPAYLPFLRIKMYLEAQDPASASEELQKLPACAGYSAHLLEVVCQEAVRAKCTPVACEALSGLHEAVASGAVSGLVEADVLRCHIRCLEVQVQTQAQAAATVCESLQRGSGRHQVAGSGCAAGEHDLAGTFTAIAVQFSTLSKRLEAVGVQGVFGPGINTDQAAASGLDWFAATGLQLGNHAGKAGCCESSTVIYVSVASSLAHHPAPTTSTHRLRRLAAGLAMMSAVAVSMEMPLKRAASLMLAKRMHGLAKELSPLCGSSSEPQVKQVQVLLTYLEAKVAVLSGDQAALLHQVHHVLPGLPPQLQLSHEQLLELASLCSGSDELDDTRGVVQQLYQLALQKLVAQGSPDYEQIAWLLHAKLELCDTDTGRLAAFKEAAALIGQLAAGAQADLGEQAAGADAGKVLLFPQVELEWLVATCWNRGAQHARFMQTSLAAEFMQAALELLKFTTPEYAQPLKLMMEEQLSRLTKTA